MSMGVQSDAGSGAPMMELNSEGPRKIREVGGIVFVEKNRFAGVGSMCPSLSSAETQKT